MHPRPPRRASHPARARALHTAPRTLFPHARTASATTTTFHSPALCDALTLYQQRTTPRPPRDRPRAPCWRACRACGRMMCLVWVLVCVCVCVCVCVRVCVCGLFCGAHHTQITHSPPTWTIAATQCFPNTPMTRIDSLAEQFKALAQSANRKRARARTSQLSGMPWLLRLRLTSVRGHSGTQPRTATSSALRSPTSSDPSPPHRHSRPFPLSVRAHLPLPCACPTCFDLFDAPMSAAAHFIVQPIWLQPSTTPRDWPPLGVVALARWPA